MKKIVMIFICMFASAANAVTVNFTEESTLAAYSSYGLSFDNALLLNHSGLFPTDSFGIINGNSGTPFLSTITIDFTQAVENIDLDWVIVSDAHKFFATAYDADDNVVDSFSYLGGGTGTTGLYFDTTSLSGTGIEYLKINDSGNQIGIDTLSYTLDTTVNPVPVPAAAWLFGTGLIGLITVARRKA